MGGKRGGCGLVLRACGSAVMGRRRIHPAAAGAASGCAREGGWTRPDRASPHRACLLQGTAPSWVSPIPGAPPPRCLPARSARWDALGVRPACLCHAQHRPHAQRSVCSLRLQAEPGRVLAADPRRRPCGRGRARCCTIQNGRSPPWNAAPSMLSPLLLIPITPPREPPLPCAHSAEAMAAGSLSFEFEFPGCGIPRMCC